MLDFGLSKAPPEFRGKSDEMTGSHSTFGTPQYMSPEQVRSTKDVDARTDQHALALVLFQLITGRAAFEAASVVDLLIAITAQARAAAPVGDAVGAEGTLKHALARALQKAKPADRFPTVAEFAEAIAPFGGPGEPRRPRATCARSSSTRGRSRPRRRPPIRRAPTVPRPGRTARPRRLAPPSPSRGSRARAIR